jgi:hypothetical protein
MGFKSYLGVVTLLIGLVSYGLYFIDIFKGKTKPHAMSWLVWGVLNSVIFLFQQTSGAGAGSWITAFSATAALLIFITSLRYGEKKITKLDGYCVLGAAVSLLLWFTQRHGEPAVILASITFVLGFIPTYRKAYSKPYQETILTFTLNSTKFLIALFALSNLAFASLLYPATLAFMNLGFVIFLFIRRKQISEKG